jgi:carbon starvation protein CstA
VGPANVIIWGWTPAMLWIFVGSIVMGAVHISAPLSFRCTTRSNWLFLNFPGFILRVPSW